MSAFLCAGLLLLLLGGPRRVLLRYEPLGALGQERQRVGGGRVVPGLGLGEELLVLERLRRRAVLGPVGVELEELLGKKVFLELFVKVKPGWRQSAAFVEELDWRRSVS